MRIGSHLVACQGFLVGERAHRRRLPPRTLPTCTWLWPRPSEATLSSPLMTPTSPESTPDWSSSTSDLTGEVPLMAGKPVAADGKRFCAAELEAARWVRLAEVIARS